MTEPIVDTRFGRVRGAREDGLAVFRGIPYAASTAGRQRFRPPSPPEPWVGVRDALRFGCAAPQTDPLGARPNPMDHRVVAPGLALWRSEGVKPAEPESEDCLSLNVWTPSLDPAHPRPVMVWLHGGGFDAGSGAEPMYRGGNLARRRDVVVVTINHRLSVLGYTHLGDIGGEEFARSGNAGTLDQVAALEWVRDHIAGFGGDPNRVMIFGQSGGGWKVSTLLGAAPAAGLFQRAAIQSGPAKRVLDRDRANLSAELLLHELGLLEREAGRLRDLPVGRLVSASYAVERRLGPPVLPNFLPAFAPVLDGEVVPAHPFDPVAAAASRDVSVLIGNTRTEMTPYSDAATLSLDAPGLEDKARAWLGDAGSHALDVYRHLHPEAEPARLWAYLQSDVTMLPYTPVIAERHAKLGGSPTYLYRIDWETPVLDGRLIAPHAIELPLLFHNFRELPATCGSGAATAAMADRFSAAWAAFAETGDPNCPDGDLPPWPAYDAVRRATMLLGDESAVADDPQRIEAVLATELMPEFEAQLAARLGRARSDIAGLAQAS